MRNKYPLPFWERTSRLMKSHKITQEKFANYAGINFYTFRGWLYYGIVPDVNSAYKIATALGVSIEYLVTGNDERSAKIREKQTLVRKTAAAKIKKMALQIEKNVDAIG
jgi:transcriptional regulator with XRE-family HTH domain